MQVRKDVANVVQSTLADTRSFARYQIDTDRAIANIAWIIRLATVFGLTIVFGFDHDLDYSPELLTALRWGLWLYFFYTVALGFVRIFHRSFFFSSLGMLTQVILDLTATTFFYAISGNTQSDVFLLFFPPLILAAHYLSVSQTFACWLVAVIGLAAAFVGIPELFSAPAASEPARILVPRILALGAATFGYALFRHRSPLAVLTKERSELLEPFDRIADGIFTVDTQLRVRSMDESMRAKHGGQAPLTPCSQVFCASLTDENGSACKECPVQQAASLGSPIENVERRLIDQSGQSYAALLSSYPVLDAQARVVGTAVRVRDTDQRANLRQHLQDHLARTERHVMRLTQEHQTLSERFSRQLESALASSLAAIAPGDPSSMARIVREAAETLHCQAGVLRRIGQNPERDRPSLVLLHSYGLATPYDEDGRYLDLDSGSVIVGAFLSGETITMEDIQASSRGDIHYTSHVQETNLHAMLCLPLSHGDKKQGSLTLYRIRSRPFSSDEIRVGQLLANLLAVIIAQTDLFEQVQTESETRKLWRECIETISQELIPENGLAPLSELVVEMTREKLDSEVSSIFLLENGKLSRKAISGMPADWFPDECYEPGEGLTGQPLVVGSDARCGLPAKSNDVDDDPRTVHGNLVAYKQSLPSAQVKHLIAVPLNGRNGPFGVLRVVNRLQANHLHPTGFSQDHTDLLAAIACVVAVAFEGTMLHDETVERLQHLRVLYDIISNLRTSLNVDQTLNLIVNYLSAAFDLDTCTIGLWDANLNVLHFRASVGIGANVTRHRNDLPPDLVRASLSSSQPMVMADLYDEPDLRLQLERQDLSSFVILPLLGHSAPLGVITLGSSVRWVPSQEEQELLQALAGQAAIAIENARTYESSQIAAQENELLARRLSMIHEFALEMQNATSIELILNIALTGVTAAYGLRFNRAAILLLDKDHLVGRMGIGQLDRDDATRTWEKLVTKEISFGHYLRLLRAQQGIVTTPIGQKIRGLAIPLTDDDTEAFSRVVKDRQPFIYQPGGAVTIDPGFIQAFQPAECVLVPLLTQNEVIGVLVADSKFSREPITKPLLDLLAVLSSHTAAVIEGVRLNQDLEKRVEMLQNLRAVGNLISEATELQQVLSRIAQAAKDVMKANVTTILPFNAKTGEFEPDYVATAGARSGYAHDRTFREEGLTNVVFGQEDGMVLVERLSDHPDFITGFARQENLESIAAVRLQVADEIVGILFVNYRAPHTFAIDERQTMRMFAAQAAIAIKNARLLHETKRGFNALSILQETSLKMASVASDIENLLPAIAASAVSAILGAEGSTIHILDEGTETLLPVASFPFTPESLGQTVIKVGEGVAGTAVASGTMIHVPDTSADPLYARHPSRQDPPPGSLLVTPLLAGTKCLGSLSVNGSAPGCFTEQDEWLLRTLATQAAYAIQNANLFSAQRQRAEMLEDLAVAVQFLETETKLDDLADLAVQAAKEIFEAQDCCLFVTAQKRTTLNVLCATNVPRESYAGKRWSVRETTGGGLAPFVAATGSTLRFSGVDCREHPAWEEGIENALWPSDGWTTPRMLTPIEDSTGQIVGVLQVVGRDEQHRGDSFSLIEESVFEAFAAYVGVAIERAKLFRKIEESASERERERLRHDLHDAMNDFHSLVMFETENIADSVEAGGRQDVVERLRSLWHSQRTTYEYLSRILFDLDNPVLVNQGVVEALQRYPDQIAYFELDFDIQGDVRPPYPVEHALYRIAQEALHNVAKHARLPQKPDGRAELRLALQPTWAELTVSDNGVGFAGTGDGLKRGIGMSALRRWAQSIEADLKIESEPGHGTLVNVVARWQEEKK